MHRVIALSALLVIWCVVAGCAASHAGAPAGRPPDVHQLEPRLERLRERWKVPGMSAAVAREGSVLWERGFGEADMAAHRPASPGTVFHLASLTKPFAATVLLQLVQEDRLSLDAPVDRFGIKLDAHEAVRVRHLLTHTSEKLPGETYRYNGSRFRELDKVVAGVTGRSFAGEVGRRILDPLRLTHTAPNPQSPTDCRAADRSARTFRDRLAQGYASDGRHPVEYRPHFSTAAGMVSTAADVLRFSAALEGGRLLGPEMQRLMFTPAATTRGSTLPYAIGWFVQNWRGRAIVWHYGWWVGSSSLIVTIPQDRISFVLLANSDGLSRKFDLGRDSNVRRSPFARTFLAACGL